MSPWDSKEGVVTTLFVLTGAQSRGVDYIIPVESECIENYHLRPFLLGYFCIDSD